MKTIEWLIRSGQTLWCVIHGLLRIVLWCLRHMMNIEAVSFLWPSMMKVEYITWVIDFKTTWPLYSSTGFDWFNLTQMIWSFSHTWSANLSLIKEYSMALMLIRNFKCKLKESLVMMPSVSRSFQAQISNRFWTKETKKILNDALNFIASFMKHKNFLNCSDHLLRDHHHHYCWNIVPQNFDRRVDHQAGIQPP